MEMLSTLSDFADHEQLDLHPLPQHALRAHLEHLRLQYALLLAFLLSGLETGISADQSRLFLLLLHSLGLGDQRASLFSRVGEVDNTELKKLLIELREAGVVKNLLLDAFVLLRIDAQLTDSLAQSLLEIARFFDLDETDCEQLAKQAAQVLGLLEEKALWEGSVYWPQVFFYRNGDAQSAYTPLGLHADSVSSLVISADGRWALSGSNDNTMKLWGLETGKCLRSFEGHSDSVNSVAVSPDGRWGLSGSGDKTMKLWELETGQCLRSFEGHSDSVNSVAVSPDGRWALSGSNDNTMKLWELETGKCLRSFEGHSYSVTSVAISPDGRWALSGSMGDDTLKLWELETGKCLRSFKGHSYPVYSVAVSPDGRWGLSGSWDKTMKLWELETGKCLRSFEGHSYPVYSVAISPDGRWALSESVGDDTLKLWELETGQCLRSFTGHADSVRTITNFVDVFGRAGETFKGHSGSVQTVTFSPNGQWILSGGEDHAVLLWEVK